MAIDRALRSVVWSCVASGQDIVDRPAGGIRNVEGFFLFDVYCMALLEPHVTGIYVEDQRTADGTENLLVPLARAYQPIAFVGLEASVNHVARMRVQILHAEYVFTTLCRGRLLKIERFHVPPPFSLLGEECSARVRARMLLNFPRYHHVVPVGENRPPDGTLMGNVLLLEFFRIFVAVLFDRVRFLRYSEL